MGRPPSTGGPSFRFNSTEVSYLALQPYLSPFLYTPIHYLMSIRSINLWVCPINAKNCDFKVIVKFCMGYFYSFFSLIPFGAPRKNLF